MMETSDRLDELTISIIQENTISTRSFMRKAIVNNIGVLQRLSRKAGVMRRAAMCLDEIDEADITIPEVEIDTHLFGQDKCGTFTVQYESEIGDKINNVCSNTGMNPSDVRRLCYLLSLEDILSEGDMGYHELSKVCGASKFKLGKVRTHFHGVLHNWFIKDPELTKKRIEENEIKFNNFAMKYDEIYNSQVYIRLLEEYGYRAFSEAENFIEMYTDYEYSKDSIQVGTDSIDARDLLQQ